MTAADIGDVPLFENPDPRGPCGAVVPELPLSGGFGRSFTGEDVVLVELVVAAGKETDQYLAGLQADVHPGCGSYTSRTNTGATQEVSGVEFVDLEDLGAPAVGWTSTIELGGQALHGGAIAFRVDDYFAFIQVQGFDPPTTASMETLANHAVDRLRS